MGASKSACKEIHCSGSKHWISLWYAVIGCCKIPAKSGKFLNLSKCSWIPTGMVMPEQGRCSFGVLGFWHTLPRLQDSQSPECSDRGPGLGPWECAGSGRNRKKRVYSALFLANSLFPPPPPAYVPPFFSLFQPIFTVFHPFSSYYAFLSLFRLYSLRSNLFAQSHPFFSLCFTLFISNPPIFLPIPPFYALFHPFSRLLTFFSLFDLLFILLLSSFHSFFKIRVPPLLPIPPFIVPITLFSPSLFHLFSFCSSGFSPYSTNFLPILPFFFVIHVFFPLILPFFSPSSTPFLPRWRKSR